MFLKMSIRTINYAFDKGYKLNNFSKFETMEKTLETRATFELDR